MISTVGISTDHPAGVFIRMACSLRSAAVSPQCPMERGSSHRKNDKEVDVTSWWENLTQPWKKGKYAGNYIYIWN